MSRFCKKFVCALFLVALMLGTAMAEDLEFTVSNRSAFTMEKIVLSPTGITNWARMQEVQGNFPVYTGDKVEVKADDYGYQYWDMCVVFEDGKQWEYHNVDLFSSKYITINVDGRALDDTGKYYDFPKPKYESRVKKAKRVR